MPTKYKTNRLILHLFLCIFSCNTIFSQPRQLNFINYSVKDGMSHGIVDAFVRDKDGFLWIATYNGLDRFDGTSFKIFHSDYHNPNAIIDNYVHDVCEDRDGNIWSGCEKGVSCYNKATGKFSNYRLTNPHGLTLTANLVYNILCDKHGTLWCASEAGVFEFDKQHDNFKGYYHVEKDSTSLSSDKVYKNAFIEDTAKDGIWIGTLQGINFLDIKTKKFYNYQNNPQHLSVFFNKPIYPLAFDRNSNLCFFANDKPLLFCYNTVSKKLVENEIETDKPPYKISADIATFFFDSKNNVWISTWDSKLFYKENGANIFKQIVHDNSNINSISNTFCWDINEDANGTIWFGTLNGISKLQASAQSFYLLKPNKSLVVNEQFKFINAVFQADSILWLGTNAGLYSYNLQTTECKKFKNTIAGKSDYVNYIIPVRHHLWLAGLNEVNIFDLTNKKFLDTTLLPTDWKSDQRQIRNIHVCRNGDVWIIADNNRDLFHFEKKIGKWILYKHNADDPHSVSSIITQAMCEESNGSMWFGTLEGGLMRFNEQQNNFDFFTTAYIDTSKVKIQYAIRICEAKKDELYLMLGRYGLMKYNYKDSTAKLFRQSDGLAAESNFDMLQDNEQNIWLAGYQDITAVNIKKNIFKRFHIDYAYGDFDYGNVCTLFKNGDIGITISDAIAIYKPAILSEEKNVSPVLISGFSVFENSIPFTQKNPNINLSYKQNFFSISFSNFSNSTSDLQYAYKLENFDKDWVYCGKRQIAFYTNVPGGDYTFLVKAAAANGEWSSPTTIHISVTPPFWETAWFRGIAVALLIFIVVAIFKIREKNYREKQEQKLQLLKMRDKIAQDLHDDIGASLSSIRMYSDAVRMQVKEKLPQADMILERISENSKEIVENMSDIVWAINPKNDSLQFMEDRMRAFTSAVCSSKNIIPHFNQIDFHELKLPMGTRKNIFLVFKEAINNAAKYSACKNIYVNMEKRASTLMLSVADDGKGFDVAKATKGNGLMNMQKRATELKAEILIESNINEGTTIKIFAPLPGAEKHIPTNGDLKT